MERFPKSLISFQRMFPDEAACAAWLFSMRWPEGFQWLCQVNCIHSEISVNRRWLFYAISMA